MKNTQTLLIASLLMILFSCKKENPVTNNDPDPNPEADTPVLLTRLVLLDTTMNTPMDTMTVYNISYDTHFRPVTLQYINYSSGAASTTTTMRYEYQAADSIANKTTTITAQMYLGVMTYYHDTIYYTYDAGKLVADSMIGGDGIYYKTHHYTYYPDRIAATYSFERTDIGYWENGWDVFYQSESNGNLVHQADTLMYNYISSGSPAEQWNHNDVALTYLPNPDPFYKVIKPVKRPYFLESDWSWEYAPFFVSPNLPVVSQRNYDQWNTAGTGGSAYGYATSTYSYEFRADGYPLIMRQFEAEIGPYNRYYKMMYYYNR